MVFDACKHLPGDNPYGTGAHSSREAVCRDKYKRRLPRYFLEHAALVAPEDLPRDVCFRQVLLGQSLVPRLGCMGT